MLRRPPRAARIAAAALAGIVALTACSNTSSPVNRRPHTGSATAVDVNGVEQVTIQAGDDFRFNPSTIYVHTGRTVRIVLVHTGTGAPHDWQLSAFPSDMIPLLSAQGQQGSTTFVAPSPGRYQFVCTIHLRQGQTGTLVVLP
jgi:plastocyanin